MTTFLLVHIFVKGILWRNCRFVFVNMQHSKMAPPPWLRMQIKERERERAAMVEWAWEWMRRASSAGKNKVVNQINKMLFSDCFSTVMFKTTNENTHTSAQILKEVQCCKIVSECRVSSCRLWLSALCFSSALGQTGLQVFIHPWHRDGEQSRARQRQGCNLVAMQQVPTSHCYCMGGYTHRLKVDAKKVSWTQQK